MKTIFNIIPKSKPGLIYINYAISNYIIILYTLVSTKNIKNENEFYTWATMKEILHWKYVLHSKMVTEFKGSYYQKLTFSAL